MPKIVIFRAGRHTSMQGATLDFSEADIAASCAAYNPAVHEAPLVVGHPKTAAPAYGWVEGLGVSGADVAADYGQVNPDFAELAKSDAFKKVSASVPELAEKNYKAALAGYRDVARGELTLECWGVKAEEAVNTANSLATFDPPLRLMGQGPWGLE